MGAEVYIKNIEIIESSVKTVGALSLHLLQSTLAIDINDRKGAVLEKETKLISTPDFSKYGRTAKKRIMFISDFYGHVRSIFFQKSKQDVLNTDHHLVDLSSISSGEENIETRYYDNTHATAEVMKEIASSISYHIIPMLSNLGCNLNHSF